MPQEHHLGPADSVSFDQLDRDELVFYSRHLAPAAFDNIVDQSDRYDFSLNITTEVLSGATVLRYVASGAGLTLIPRLATKQQLDGVVFIPIHRPCSLIHSR